MIYDNITKAINDFLGGNFIIEYANDYNIDWKKILPEAQDKIIIKGRTYKVVTKSSYIENDNQGRLKGSIDDFTGHQVVGLE